LCLVGDSLSSPPSLPPSHQHQDAEFTPAEGELRVAAQQQIDRREREGEREREREREEFPRTTKSGRRACLFLWLPRIKLLYV